MTDDNACDEHLNALRELYRAMRRSNNPSEIAELMHRARRLLHSLEEKRRQEMRHSSYSAPYELHKAVERLEDDARARNRALFKQGIRTQITRCVDGSIPQDYVYPDGWPLADELGIFPVEYGDPRFQSEYQILRADLNAARHWRITIREWRNLKHQEELVQKRLLRREEKAGIERLREARPVQPGEEIQDPWIKPGDDEWNEFPHTREVDFTPYNYEAPADAPPWERIAYYEQCIALVDAYIESLKDDEQREQEVQIRQWAAEGLSANKMAERLGGNRQKALRLIKDTLGR